jgi:hypothetical protein
MSKTPVTLPGIALLEQYLADQKLTRAALARKASEFGKVDRVTLVNILEGHITRVSTEVSFALQRATEDRVPAHTLIPVPLPVAAAKRRRAARKAA